MPAYPLVICYIAIENDHLYWIYPLKMVIFRSYVSLPEGTIRRKPPVRPHNFLGILKEYKFPPPLNFTFNWKDQQGY